MLYEINLQKYMMGTTVEIKAVHPDILEAKKGIYFAFKEIERIDKRLGYQGNGSDVARINDFAGKHPVKIGAETFRLLARAKAYAEKYQGDFDPTIGAIAELWGFNLNRPPSLPQDADLQQTLPLVNYRRLILSENDTTAFLTRKNMRLDLGGIAKGYAIDRAVEILRRNKVENFIIKAGGDMFVSGMKSATEKWQIGIRHPRAPGEIFAIMEIKDCAISTSGDYERFFMKDAVRYHHILDPKTGRPSRRCKSVSVLSETSAEATDVLSTTLFIKGIAEIRAAGTFKNYLILDETGNLHLDSTLVHRYKLRTLTKFPIGGN
ncbi:FAD:protein FMN transferase [Chloroherpeton thalassium]|uniref:FAD:protein FMN transferase n=1 Tax=Chloroherpeton thalassium TaxID=100716 RepID=UPI000317F96A|nr:FAD:protein FMN transferase [Chloroherpeton thalassium]